MKTTGSAPTDDERLIAAANTPLPKNTKITPMLRQWLQAKAKSNGAVLLFRMGDFYELFGDDAKVAGDVLDLAVTTRDRDKGDDAMPMAGFPHPQAPVYIAKLIAAGLKVAVCDQLEDPALAKGIVKRDVTRVVTPGMVLEEESLDAASNNFLVGIAVEGASPRYGLCALDVSTGEVLCSVADDAAAVIDEVLRLAPRELVIDDTIGAALVEHLEDDRRRVERRAVPAKRTLTSSLGAPDAWLMEPSRKVALMAAELCLQYAKETGQGTLPRHLRAPRAVSLAERLLVDATARAHLAVCGPAGDLRRPGTLLWHLDRTKTAAGARRLLRRLLEPSSNLDDIERKLDRCDSFVADPALRATLAEHLSGMNDVERLVARAASLRAGPRELVRLSRAAARLPKITAALAHTGPWLDAIAPHVDDVARCAEVATHISAALCDDAPAVLGDERAIAPGFDKELDTLWTATQTGQAQIAALEAREKEATGVASLKVRFNNVFGYFIEMTKTHAQKAPSHYIRKQTIANGERFTTDELQALQELLEGADLKRRRREAELFDALLAFVGERCHSLLAVAAIVADVDATLSLAEVSVGDRCVRPTLVPKEQRTLVVEDLRHPVVARLCAERGEAYVPASLQLDGERQIVVITGPNMAGKSTLMRQVAVCQLLAQAGAHVPATQAVLSLCDRIYTRVGADDDTVSGRSTFMVEMSEASHILRGATPHSLVILDEIGRGTSTFDGLAIAWAIVEHLHDVTFARTLFATHYHELTSLDQSLSRLKNLHVVVKEWGDDIVFVRTLEEGAAGRSFGIQVARLAGLPDAVVERARAVLAHLEGTTPDTHDVALPARPRRRAALPQMSLFDSTPPTTVAEPAVDPLIERLKRIDAHRLTPIDALVALAELADAARKR